MEEERELSLPVIESLAPDERWMFLETWFGRIWARAVHALRRWRQPMSQVGTVRLVKLVLPHEELEKLTATERKRYVMLTSILRDMTILQKYLIFAGGGQAQETEVETSAEAIQILFVITTLGAKLHEAGIFLQKEGIVDNVPIELYQVRQEVLDFYADDRTNAILKFIRNKFGFHYDTYDDLDPRIDDAFSGLPEVRMYLSEDDAGNELFPSTNDVISSVLLEHAKCHGFEGDRAEFVRYLFDVHLTGARVVSRFGRAYLVQCFPVQWTESERFTIPAPSIDEVAIPPILRR